MKMKKDRINSRPEIYGIIMAVIIVFIILGSIAGKEEDETTATTTTEATSTKEVIAKSTTAKDEYSNNSEEESTSKVATNTYEYNGKEYTIIEVDGGDKSGDRQSNVAVDIGFGDRVYWGLTNEYGQLVYVLADKIVIQDDDSEPVNSDGRYYDDEAYVPGVEADDLDQGHVIADSLGGVSNAYNITPQNSTLNRYGDQAYMEKVIRDAGGCTNFVATITYSSATTQIPSHYKFTYILNGNEVVDDFDNVNPEPTTEAAIATTEATTKEPTTVASFDENAELAKVDTNGNGIVTISEAEAAGYSMPIHSDHWLYKYMRDADGDGTVGE